MSGILQDSLELKDFIPEGAEESWTELLERESPVNVLECNDPHVRLDRLMDPHLGKGSQIPLSEE